MATKNSAKVVFTLTVAAMLDLIFVQVGYFALILENISNSLAPFPQLLLQTFQAAPVKHLKAIKVNLAIFT